MDSILDDTDTDLEYFDVLNLLPLSNVRLELNETKPGNIYTANESEESRFDQALDHALNEKTYLARKLSPEKRETEEEEEASLLLEKNITDEEKSSVDNAKHKLLQNASILAGKRKSQEMVGNRDKRKSSEEAEDVKSMWVSDSEDEADVIAQQSALSNGDSKCRSVDRENWKNKQNEERLDRVVKETVKGGILGLEMRSNGLGFGDHLASDAPSMDVRESMEGRESKICGNLTRSRSYVDSMNCQEPSEPEFDHVRYKIVKSNAFEKSVYVNSAKNEASYDGLMEYLKQYSFQVLFEILL